VAGGKATKAHGDRIWPKESGQFGGITGNGIAWDKEFRGNGLAGSWHILVHDCQRVDVAILCQVLTDDLPLLVPLLRKLVTGS
jgi:hypothetical protein